MPAANIATKYNPILWINSNLDDPRQIREIMRELPYWAMDIQRSVTTLLTNPAGGGGTGTGDMLKSTYDTNNNGIVDSCDSLPYSRLTGIPATFTPSAHAPTHLDNGTDPIPVVTTTRTGLAPKLSGSSSTYLNGNGAFSTPPGFTDAPNDANTYGRHAAAWVGVLPLTGGTISGPLTVLPPAGQGPICLTLTGNPTDGWAQQYFSKASGTTGVGNAIVSTVNGPPNYRWALSIGDNTVESGGNAGSDFKLESYSDAGASLGVALKILRATLATQFGGPVTLAADPTTTLGAATKQYVDSGVNSRVPTSRQVLTAQSLTGGGDLSADRTLSLVGDTASPGNLKLYGTNGAGVRGWYAQPSGTGGDMTRAVYDTDSNGVVDTCDSLAWAKITGAPLASSSQNGLLKQVSGLTTDLVDGTNNCQSIDSATRPTIYSVRLRSWNAVGNPNFEIDMRNAGTTTSPTNSVFALDRWFVQKNGTMVLSTQQTSSGVTPIVPGTSFYISSRSLLLTLTTQEASLAAGDYWGISHNVEGSNNREMISDVSSISLLISTNVFPLKFAVALRDSPATKSLVKLCTISSIGYNLIQLPNIPVMPSGNFSRDPGSVGYTLTICFACGSTLTAPSLDVWNAGNFIGAPGMDNFAGKPAATSNINIGFVQHEPGAVCTTLIDKPFSQNLDECLRYYCKSYPQSVKAGTVNGPGAIGTPTIPSQNIWCPVRFPKVMAKAPTVIAWSDVTGAGQGVRDIVLNGDRAVSGYFYPGDSGFAGCSLTTTNAAQSLYTFHYTADTGW